MDQLSFAKLARGDVIRLCEGDLRSYTVQGNLSGLVTAMADTVIRTPAEWLRSGVPIDRIASLAVGQAVQNVNTGNDYIVAFVHARFALAVKAVVITEGQADAWMLTAKTEFRDSLAEPDGSAAHLEEASA